MPPPPGRHSAGHLPPLRAHRGPVRLPLRLDPAQLGELIRAPAQGQRLHTALRSFPRVAVAAESKPLSRSTLRVDITVAADFSHDVALGLGSSSSTATARASSASQLLKQTGRDAETFSVAIPLVDQLPFAYFVRVESDTWLGCTAVAPVLLATTIVPSPSRRRWNSSRCSRSQRPRSIPLPGCHPISFDLLPKRRRRRSTGGVRCGRRTQCRRRFRHWENGCH